MARKNGYFDTVFKDDPFNQFDDTTLQESSTSTKDQNEGESRSQESTEQGKFYHILYREEEYKYSQLRLIGTNLQERNHLHRS